MNPITLTGHIYQEEQISLTLISRVGGALSAINELGQMPMIGTLVSGLKLAHRGYRWYKLRGTTPQNAAIATTMHLAGRFIPFISLPLNCLLIMKCYLDVQKKLGELKQAYSKMKNSYSAELYTETDTKPWLGKRMCDRIKIMAHSVFQLLARAFEFAMILEDVRLFLNQDDKTRYVSCVELATNVDEYVQEGQKLIESIFGVNIHRIGAQMAMRLHIAGELVSKAEEYAIRAAQRAEEEARKMAAAAVDMTEQLAEDPFHPMGQDQGEVLQETSEALGEVGVAIVEGAKDTIEALAEDTTVAMKTFGEGIDDGIGALAEEVFDTLVFAGGAVAETVILANDITEYAVNKSVEAVEKAGKSVAAFALRALLWS